MPATKLGVATASGPTSDARSRHAGPREHVAASPRPARSRARRSRSARRRPVRISTNAPPPSPAEKGCVTASAKAVATAASTALPPRSSIASPARVASRLRGHHHAAAPQRGRGRGGVRDRRREQPACASSAAAAGEAEPRTSRAAEPSGGADRITRSAKVRPRGVRYARHACAGLARRRSRSPARAPAGRRARRAQRSPTRQPQPRAALSRDLRGSARRRRARPRRARRDPHRAAARARAANASRTSSRSPRAASTTAPSFHRVIPGFMIQGGDPELEEPGPARRRRRRLRRAPDRRVQRLPAPARHGLAGQQRQAGDTASSQFFIVHQDSPHLDGALLGLRARVRRHGDGVMPSRSLPIDVYGRYGPRDRPYPQDAVIRSVRIERAASAAKPSQPLAAAGAPG